MTAQLLGKELASSRPPVRVLNMSTGPVEVSQSVLKAQQIDLLTPHTESFWQLHDETTQRMGRILRTQNRTLLMHGSIRTGIDLALGNVIKPGTKVLSIVNGFWGELVAEWAERHGADVTRLCFGLLEPVDPERVSELMSHQAFDLVTVIHVETNSGVVNPIADIGKIVNASDALYFVDTACSAGAMQIETDAWGIDIQTTGSHKCMSSVPGLSVVTVSDKAWDRISADNKMGTFFNFRHWWANTIERNAVPPFTQAPTLISALNTALREIEDFGIYQWWELHAAAADRLMDGVRAAGFRLLLDEGAAALKREFYSDTVIAIAYPDHIDDVKYRKYLMEKSGIFVIGNVGKFAGKSFRVGLMSPPQIQSVNLLGALAAFGDAANDTATWK